VGLQIIGPIPSATCWDREFADSSLERNGFELPVPRAMQERLKATIAGFGCNPPWPDYLRLLSVDISEGGQSEVSEPEALTPEAAAQRSTPQPAQTVRQPG
jgi:hypothetical protein